MSRTQRRVSPEQRAELTTRAAELYQAGMPLRDVAANLGHPANTIYDWLRRAGIPTRPVGGSTQPATTAERAILRSKLRAQYEAGASIQELATAHGYPAGMIGRYLHAAGTPMRGPGRRTDASKAGEQR